MGALTVDQELGDLRETILGDKEYTMSDGVLYSLVFLRELKVGDGSQLLIVFISRFVRLLSPFQVHISWSFYRLIDLTLFKSCA